MNRKILLATVAVLTLAAVLWSAWQMGAFARPVGAGRPADVYLPDGTVLHTTWDAVFQKLKTHECYRDGWSGGFRYRTDSGVWGIAVHPGDPPPDLSKLKDPESAGRGPIR